MGENGHTEMSGWDLETVSPWYPYFQTVLIDDQTLIIELMRCFGTVQSPEIIFIFWIKKYISIMAPHSSTLAWKIPWMEEPGRLQSMGSLRVGHDWATSLSLFTFMHWRRKWQPTPVFLPGESQGREAWWAAIYGVAQSRTQLKRLSSSSSSRCWQFDLWFLCLS